MRQYAILILLFAVIQWCGCGGVEECDDVFGWGAGLDAVGWSEDVSAVFAEDRDAVEDFLADVSGGAEG